MLLQRKYESRLASSNSVKRAILARLFGLDQEQELGRREHRGQGELDGAFVALAPVVGQPKDPQDPFDFLRLNRPAKGPFGEPRDHPAGAIEPRLIAVLRACRTGSADATREAGHASTATGPAHDHRVDVQARARPHNAGRR